MQAILDKLKTVVTASISLITSQKDTIVDLKTRLAAKDSEFAEFVEAEGIEDANTEAFLAQLSEISDTLSNFVDESTEFIAESTEE